MVNELAGKIQADAEHGQECSVSTPAPGAGFVEFCILTTLCQIFDISDFAVPEDMVWVMIT